MAYGLGFRNNPQAMPRLCCQKSCCLNREQEAAPLQLWGLPHLTMVYYPFSCEAQSVSLLVDKLGVLSISRLCLVHFQPVWHRHRGQWLWMRDCKSLVGTDSCQPAEYQPS